MLEPLDFLNVSVEIRSTAMSKPDSERNKPPKTDEELKKLKDAVNNLDRPAQPRNEPPPVVPSRDPSERR